MLSSFSEVNTLTFKSRDMDIFLKRQLVYSKTNDSNDSSKFY